MKLKSNIPKMNQEEQGNIVDYKSSHPSDIRCDPRHFASNYIICGVFV